MTPEIEINACLPLRCNGLVLAQDIEVVLTVSLQDDGMNGVHWSILRIEADNLEGTGWFRWSWQDCQPDSDQTLFNELGKALMAAAYADRDVKDEAEIRGAVLVLGDAA